MRKTLSTLTVAACVSALVAGICIERASWAQPGAADVKGTAKTSASAPKAGAKQGKKLTTSAKTADVCVAKKETADKSSTSKSAADKAANDAAQVLDPSQFFGSAAMGYASAKSAPEIMSKLFCYCGCDTTDNHSSLLDCFTSMHGVDCHICQEEAVMALRLHREGVPMAEIQKQVDEQYSHYYPWEQDTLAYKKYKSARLWKSGDQNSGADTTTASDNKPDCPATKSGADKMVTKPKLKPGFKEPDCCKADHK